MNSLEDKLRTSRTTEVPGLQPPAGGWDAVRKQLTNVPPGGPAPTAAKGFLMKPWLILFATVTSLALAYFLLPGIGSTPVFAANETGRKTEMPSATKVDEVVATKPTAVSTAASTRIRARSASVSTMPSEAVVVPSLSAETKVRNSDSITEPTRKATGQSTTLPASEAVEESSLKPSATPKRNNAEDMNDGVTELAPKAETLQNSEVKPEEARVEDVLTNINETAIRPLEEGSSSQLVSGKKKVSGAAATTMLKRSSIRPLSVGQLSVPPVSISNVPDVPEYTRKGKLKVRPELQFHGSLSGHYIPSFRRSTFYDRDVSTSAGTRLFVLPNNEPLFVRFRERDLTDNYRRNIRLDVGFNRQTSSGFLFRVTGGFYYGTDSRLQDDFDQLTGTQVREDYYLREFVVPVETGVQYTFRKRHRFRPFIGLNTVWYLYYNGVERYSFFDAQTQSGGNISELRSRGVNFGEFDLSLTAGFQYKITQQISAGINLYAHGAGSYFLESPFGIEVRYSLK